MADDILFCAKTGRQIVTSDDATKSNVIPFPRRMYTKPKPVPADTFEDEIARLHIPYGGVTFADLDAFAQVEIEALRATPRPEEDI